MLQNDGLIKPFSPVYDDLLRDESRRSGTAESVSFPRSEQEVCAILSHMSAARTPVTVQGARTGLSAGAVPMGGHIMNLSRMDRFLSLREEGGVFYLTVEPGVVLANLTRRLDDKRLDLACGPGAAYEALRRAPTQFFPPDPTETTATVGGMAACNSSGARSYRYGPTARSISALRVALSSGEMLTLPRGRFTSGGRRMRLVTDGDRELAFDIPSYVMPPVKNASGFRAWDGIDAVDLFIGSDGALGVITAAELRLLPKSPHMAGALLFLRRETAAMDICDAVRQDIPDAASIEFFDKNALALHDGAWLENPAARRSPRLIEAEAAIYVEFHCDRPEGVSAALASLSLAASAAGEEPSRSFAALGSADLERLHHIRHSIPEANNARIDRARLTSPKITKLGADIAVPHARFRDMFAFYRHSLSRSGIDSAIWGHMGDDHLHVNLIPRNEEAFLRAKEVYSSWIARAMEYGGTVSAEHGVGKLKGEYLPLMYGEKGVEEMRALKRALDPALILGKGNIVRI